MKRYNRKGKKSDNQNNLETSFNIMYTNVHNTHVNTSSKMMMNDEKSKSLESKIETPKSNKNKNDDFSSLFVQTMNVKTPEKNINNNNSISLDDLMNDNIECDKPYFDPESVPNIFNNSNNNNDDDYPSWMPIKFINNKRKYSNIERKSNIEPPTKKLCSPTNKIKTPCAGLTVINKKKRRKSSIYIENTPAGTIREQRIHRLNRKSNAQLLIDYLLNINSNQLSHVIKLVLKTENNMNLIGDKISVKDLQGIKYVGKITPNMYKVIEYLVSSGADINTLNIDGLSPIYIVMHYKNNYKTIKMMLKHSDDIPELNQTYHFDDIKISLLDIGLRLCSKQVNKLLLNHSLLPTTYSSVDIKPNITLMRYAETHNILKQAKEVLLDELWNCVDNFDIEYVKSILSHGIDINTKNINGETMLYKVVKQKFDKTNIDDIKEHFKFIEYLLENGSNINALDDTLTPMITYPIQRTSKWDTQLLELLLYNNPDITLNVADTNENVYQYTKRVCILKKNEKLIDKYYKNNWK